MTTIVYDLATEHTAGRLGAGDISNGLTALIFYGRYRESLMWTRALVKKTSGAGELVIRFR